MKASMKRVGRTVLVLPLLTAWASTALPAAAQDAETHRLTYDAAGNLLSRTAVQDGIETHTDLPLDASGRNRPASVGGVPLA